MKYLALLLLILPIMAVTIIDDFDDGIIDSTFWSFQRSENTELAEFDGVCRMRMNVGGCGGPNVCWVTKRMKKCIVGDFDAYTVFEVVDEGIGDITPFMLTATDDCTRKRASVGWAQHYGMHTFRAETIDSADTVWTILSSASTPLSAGAVRIRRTGDWFYMYYFDSWFGWFPLDSVLRPMDHVILSLHVQNQGTHEVLDVAVDSFVVECDSIWWSQCDPPVLEPLCMNETVQIEITDDEGVLESTIKLSVDGIPYFLPSPLLDWDGEVLTYFPPAPWLTGSDHEICVYHVEDIIGNTSLDTICWNFTTDLIPPEISEPIPSPGDTIYDYEPLISCRVVDAHHEIDESYLRMVINSIARPFASYDGEYFTFDMSTVGYPLRIGSEIEVCIQAADLIVRCAPNDTMLCWTFVTGDSIRPSVGPHFPDTLISTCANQVVSILVTDNVEILETSIEIQAGGNTYSWPENMSITEDTLFFSPDFDWVHGINTISISQITDIWENPPYVVPINFDINIDLHGPIFSGLQPEIDEIVSTTSPEIRFIAFDAETNVLPDSFIVTINDTIQFELNSSNPDIYSLSGDTVIFLGNQTALHLSGGTEVNVCVSAFDTPDLCAGNLGDTCWIFSIAEGGPIAAPVLPQPEMITACDYSEISILVLDPDSVNWSSLEIFILDQTYTIDSPEILVSGDTLIFMPTTPFEHGEEVNAEILRLNDMLDNPILDPLTYTFRVDLFPPDAVLAFPSEGTIIRDSQPEIIVGLLEQFAPVLADSATFWINDTFEISSPHPAIEWNSSDGLEGELSLFVSRTGYRFVSGDSVSIRLRICDEPDLCRSNCFNYNWYIQMESNRPCLLTPNPFSPNLDDYNETVNFQYPGQDLDNAELMIFDKRGEEVFKQQMPASFSGDFIPERSWNGKSTQGIDLPQGTYIYLITIYGEMICNGTITLMR